MKKLKLTILLAGFVSISSYFFINNQNSYNFKKIINFNTRKVIRKYLLPYKTISLQENRISFLEEDNSSLLEKEKEKKEIGDDIEIKRSIKKLPDEKIMEKYNLISGFYAGINNFFPGTGFIDFHNKILPNHLVDHYSINLYKKLIHLHNN